MGKTAFSPVFPEKSKIGNINHPPVGMYHLDWTYQKWGIGTLIVSFIKWSSNWKYQSLSKNQGCAELVHFRCSWKFDINLHMWKGLSNLQEQSVRFPGWLFGGPGGLKHFVFIAILRMLIIWLRFFTGWGWSHQSNGWIMLDLAASGEFVDPVCWSIYVRRSSMWPLVQVWPLWRPQVAPKLVRSVKLWS